MASGVYVRTEKIRKSLSQNAKGCKWTKERLEKFVKKMTGKHWKVSEEKRANPMSYKKPKPWIRGDKNPAWKGGATKGAYLIRYSFKYAEWRQKVFIRDNFTCQKCGSSKSGTLEAHHKKPLNKLIQEMRYNLPLFNLYEASLIYEPLWDINNGKTLCKDCHNKTRGKKRKTK